MPGPPCGPIMGGPILPGPPGAPIPIPFPGLSLLSSPSPWANWQDWKRQMSNSSTGYQTKDSYRSIGALPSGPVSAEGRFVSHLESTRLLKSFQLHFRCLKVQKKESDYPWARSPQLIGAMSKIALSPPLTILCLLELLTEHLGGFVEKMLDI